MPEKEAAVALVFREEGFTHGCKSCFTVHVQGKYAITLTVGSTVFFICEPSPSTCCGLRKHWMILCDGEAEARVRMDAVNRQIDQVGGIGGLHLSLPSKMPEA